MNVVRFGWFSLLAFVLTMQTTVALAEDLQTALSSPTGVDFDKTPLRDAASYLATKHKINIVLDAKAGVDGDLPITAQLKHTTLRSALRLMLLPHEMTYSVKGNVLILTTAKLAKNMLTTKVYPAGDLIARNVDNGLRSPAHFQELVQICSTDNWIAYGGDATVVASEDVLVISQTTAAHEEVAQLLADLRRGAKGEADVSRLDSDPVESALRKPISFEFHDAPLQVVVQILAERTGVDVVVDPRHFSEATVTGSCSNLPLLDALVELLAPLKLTPTRRYGVLFITTEKEALGEVETRVYHIGDFVPPDEVEVFCEFLQCAIDIDSWFSFMVGGLGQLDYYPDLLVVSHSDRHQRQIRSFLAKFPAMLAGESPIYETLDRLDRRISCEFQKTPLHEVLEFISRKLDAKLRLDGATLRKVRDVPTPVTLRLKDVTVETLLEMLEENYGFGWALDKRALTVTSAPGEDQQQMIAAYKTLSGLSTAEMVDLIQWTVYLDSWAAVGGYGEVVEMNNRVLVIHTQKAHRRIARIIKDSKTAETKK